MSTVQPTGGPPAGRIFSTTAPARVVGGGEVLARSRAARWKADFGGVERQDYRLDGERRRPPRCRPPPAAGLGLVQRCRFRPHQTTSLQQSPRDPAAHRRRRRRAVALPQRPVLRPHRPRARRYRSATTSAARATLRHRPVRGHNMIATVVQRPAPRRPSTASVSTTHSNASDPNSATIWNAAGRQPATQPTGQTGTQATPPAAAGTSSEQCWAEHRCFATLRPSHRHPAPCRHPSRRTRQHPPKPQTGLAKIVRSLLGAQAPAASSQRAQPTGNTAGQSGAATAGSPQGRSLPSVSGGSTGSPQTPAASGQSSGQPLGPSAGQSAGQSATLPNDRQAAGYAAIGRATSLLRTLQAAEGGRMPGAPPPSSGAAAASGGLPPGTQLPVRLLDIAPPESRPSQSAQPSSAQQTSAPATSQTGQASAASTASSTTAAQSAGGATGSSGAAQPSGGGQLRPALPPRSRSDSVRQCRPHRHNHPDRQPPKLRRPGGALTPTPGSARRFRTA